MPLNPALSSNSQCPGLKQGAGSHYWAQDHEINGLMMLEGWHWEYSHHHERSGSRQNCQHVRGSLKFQLYLCGGFSNFFSQSHQNQAKINKCRISVSVNRQKLSMRTVWTDAKKKICEPMRTDVKIHANRCKLKKIPLAADPIPQLLSLIYIYYQRELASKHSSRMHLHTKHLVLILLLVSGQLRLSARYGHK